VSAPPEPIESVLDDARTLGFLGADDPRRHVEHAEAFAAAVERVTGPDGPATFLDLGTGAGVPGLVLARRWPVSRATLLDAHQRRCRFVAQAAARLALAARVDVRCERAEVAGHDPALRERFAVVVARAFAAPAVTAELGSAFVAVDGVLVVSEPPDPDPGRWPPDGLAELGLAPPVTVRAGGYAFALMTKREALAPRFPRRTGTPGKRPRW
jgi:16S rRNA (guanine527-N7)-methyltransferase